MEPREAALTFLYGVALGGMYGVYGYLTQKDPDEPFKPRKFGRTVTIWAAAAVVVVGAGDPVNEENIKETTAQVAVAGVMFDMTWSWAKREGYLPGGKDE